MKVRCPTCGKRATLPDSDVGLLALCSACGSSFRAVDSAPVVPPALPQHSLEPAAHRSALWVGLWVGAGMAAIVAIAAITWALHSWSGNVKNQKLADAARLKHQVELLMAAGRMDQAQVAYQDLDAFTAGSPWPEMRQMADETQKELAAKRLEQMQAIAKRSTEKTTVASNSTPAPAPTIPATPIPSVTAPPLPPTDQSSDTPEQVTGVPGHMDPSLGTTEGPYASGEHRHGIGDVRTVSSRPPVRAIAESAGSLTDEKIGAAITRGIDYLLQRFDPHTHLLDGAEDRQGIAIGEDILCVSALMQCQQATNDPRLNPHDATMKGLIDAMKGIDLNNYSYETYARGLRATALALYNRPEDRGILGADATVLVRGSHNGGYTYRPGRPVNARMPNFMDQNWDNSNSQYGLLGVWSAAEVAFEVPEAYWVQVQNHWTTCQNSNGTWSYHTGMGEGTHSMTCAGLASLFVTHDYLDAPKFGVAVGRDPFTPPLSRGLNWLEAGENSIDLNRGGYDLYGLERVGLASGFKFFGDHEWYRELAARSLLDQRNAGWGNVVEAAYHLLFLSRGRHPILMNKVRFDGYWANRPRDVANLARFVGYQLERPLNWQVVPISRDWTDWMDSPILYLSSHKAISISEADYDKIRSFVNNGGLLFMQADGGSEDFSRFAHDAAHKLFPQYEMTLLPANSPLCGTVFKIKPDGNLYMVTNGSRILMLFANEDLSKSWQLRDNKNKPYPFQFGTNLFIYATGMRDLRNHLVSTYIPPVSDTPRVTYRIARLSYPGNWDPEPGAWERFSRWFHVNTGYGLEVVNTPIKDLKLETAPIAQLTGTARYDLTAQEADAIKNYVEAGGVLLVDLCGGSGPFDKSLQSSLYYKSFNSTPSHVLSPNHPLLSAKADGMSDLSKPVLRLYATEVLGRSNGLGLPEEITAGKGHVILTSLDLTTGLLGTTTWGILGYDPNYAQSLVKNTILWTLDGQHDQPL
jgi:hypothetical protein